MTLSLTTSLAATITKSELEANFTSIQSKFSAGIDNSDISTGAAIAISKLAAAKEYLAVTLSTGGDAEGLDVDDQYRDYVPLPGLSGNQNGFALVSAAGPGSLMLSGASTMLMEILRLSPRRSRQRF